MTTNIPQQTTNDLCMSYLFFMSTYYRKNPLETAGALRALPLKRAMQIAKQLRAICYDINVEAIQNYERRQNIQID
jgi:hypothetical protein